MMNEKVEVQIGTRHLVVEMPELFPAEISLLAQKVSERMTEQQAHNPAVGDTSKIALLVALSFAAELEKERQVNGTAYRSGIAGRIIELASSEGSGEDFRAVLLQENSAPIKLLIPRTLIESIGRAFISESRVSLKGRMVPGGEKSSFKVSEIARST